MRRPLLRNRKVRAVAKSRFRPGLAELVLRASREAEMGEAVSTITPKRRAVAKPIIVTISNTPIPNKEST
jgi:hypothetical protein